MSVEITESSVAAALAGALDAIAAATDSASLKAARSAHLGDASALAALNGALKDVPNDQKAAAGKLVGQARAQANQAYTAAEERIVVAERNAQLENERVDVTAAPSHVRASGRHPLMLLQEEFCDAFVGMGWEIAEGPELESEWYNFDALNFDEDHPARAMQDTFFVEPAESHPVSYTHLTLPTICSV